MTPLRNYHKRKKQNIHKKKKRPKMNVPVNKLLEENEESGTNKENPLFKE